MAGGTVWGTTPHSTLGPMCQNLHRENFFLCAKSIACNIMLAGKLQGSKQRTKELQNVGSIRDRANLAGECHRIANRNIRAIIQKTYGRAMLNCVYFQQFTEFSLVIRFDNLRHGVIITKKLSREMRVTPTPQNVFFIQHFKYVFYTTLCCYITTPK
jgi:hypothetical protein